MTEPSSESVMGRLVEVVAQVIDTNRELLGDLDRAIGDGDHGVNMQRGFAAALQQKNDIAMLPLSAALEMIGNILVQTVGGASGPLYGSLFIAMGKAAANSEGDVSVADILSSGVAAVKKRGKSDRGEKTMLDVLVPVQLAWAKACEEGLPKAEALDLVQRAAKEGLESTRPLIAQKGRASFLRERSKGHLDPGAYSSFLLVDAACRTFLEERKS